MIYPITKYGAAVLESPTKPVEKFDDDLAKLCEDMYESMYVAQGVGLAATQIGDGLGGFVVEGSAALTIAK
jgi:peptide deformylase